MFSLAKDNIKICPDHRAGVFPYWEVVLLAHKNYNLPTTTTTISDGEPECKMAVLASRTL